MIELSGPAINKFDGEGAVAKDLNSIAARLAAKDSTLWGSAAEAAESPAIPSHLSHLSHCVN